MAAEVGALRVSLSLDSAAFTAGTRAATVSAQTAATGIATSFQTASTRVTASMTAMSTAMRTQLTAGMMQQVGALRTGLLSLVSPIGLIVGAASYGLTALISRLGESSEAARIHADAIQAITDRMIESRGHSEDYIADRAAEAEADLRAAEVALTVAEARREAASAAFEREGGGAIGANENWREELGAILTTNTEAVRANERVQALRASIAELRLRGRFASLFGDTAPGDPTAPETDTGPAEAAQALADRIRATELAKLKEFEAEQTEIVRQGEEDRRALRQAALGSVASIFGSLAKIVGDGSERAFKISKAFSVGEAAINTGLAITKALTGPFPFITAAAVGTAGIAQIAGILRAQPGTSTVPAVGSAPAGEAAGGGGGASAASGGHAVNITLQGESWGRAQTKALIERINAEIRDGAKLVTVT